MRLEIVRDEALPADHAGPLIHVGPNRLPATQNLLPAGPGRRRLRACWPRAATGDPRARRTTAPSSGFTISWNATSACAGCCPATTAPMSRAARRSPCPRGGSRTSRSSSRGCSAGCTARPDPLGAVQPDARPRVLPPQPAAPVPAVAVHGSASRVLPDAERHDALPARRPTTTTAGSLASRRRGIVDEAIRNIAQYFRDHPGRRRTRWA